MEHFIRKQQSERTQMLYIIIIIPILLINANNKSDIIIQYAGHSEVDITDADIVPVVIRSTTANWIEDDVVFIANEQPEVRNEKVFNDGYAKPTEKNVEDSSLRDTIFISGKNGDEIEKDRIQHKDSEKDYSVIGKEKHGDVPRKRIEIKKLDCKNLVCDNTVESICGTRKEDGRMKFRVFQNNCYYRKVNCGFRNEANRYTIVAMDQCRSIKAHVVSRPYKPLPPPVLYEDTAKHETRRSFTSRRSLSMGIDGQSCDHTCPVSCTDDYDPQCAMSTSGYRKVFLNHCKLDHHSCLNEAVWYRRPLSECVGGKKADMQQNRGFVGWLQRVGIVDKKGRLVLS